MEQICGDIAAEVYSRSFIILCVIPQFYKSYQIKVTKIKENAKEYKHRSRMIKN